MYVTIQTDTWEAGKLNFFFRISEASVWKQEHQEASTSSHHLLSHAVRSVHIFNFTISNSSWMHLFILSLLKWITTRATFRDLLGPALGITNWWSADELSPIPFGALQSVDTAPNFAIEFIFYFVHC